MIKQGLLGEFMHEAENTRKLLKMIPDSVLEYRPQPHLWSIAEIASHVANIYAWYPGTFLVDSFDLTQGNFEREDISKSANILERFEENFLKAKQAIEASDEATFFNEWTLKSGDQILIGPIPKVAAIRGFLYSHLYHHRGEIVAHLRTTGNPVPSLYGPSYEESHQG